MSAQADGGQLDLDCESQQWDMMRKKRYLASYLECPLRGESVPVEFWNGNLLTVGELDRVR